MTLASTPATPAPAALSDAEAVELGIEAYVYLYPLVTMEITRRQLTNFAPGERPGHGPAGTFAHFRAFPDAEFKAVVRPNFDTLYSSTWLDLTREPMILSVPDTAGRYYLMPILDMWTDVFAVPGKRTTGTAAGSYLIVPPGWEGETPADLRVIQAPTTHVWIIGRTQTNGPGDYAYVNAIQDGFTITPLSRRGLAPIAPSFEPDPTVDNGTPPLAQVNGMSVGAFFALGAELLTRYPPHVTDWSQLQRIRRIGLIPGEPFSIDALDAPIQAALGRVPAEALGRMQAAIPHLGSLVNGWELVTNGIGVYGDGYLRRAVVALVGLGANQPEDAVYPLCVADADGQPLDGANDYRIHFATSELPPVDAFWSVTMYDAAGFQSANPINRFAIGDRDALHYHADGSLDLYLQHESPGTDRESNWLPAPRGPLGVTMRLYSPKPEVLDGRWNPPPIRRQPA